MAEFGNNIDLSLFDPSKINWDALGATNPIPQPAVTPPVVTPSTGGGGGNPVASVSSTPSARPIPIPVSTNFSVKQPEASLVKYNSDTLPEQLITDLLFEDIGGTELISLSRHDTINGQDIVYSLIRNLSILNKDFNPNNIISGQRSSSEIDQYSLDIASKLQSVTLNSSGDLIIEFSSIGNDEYVDIQLSTNGTIYKN